MEKFHYFLYGKEFTLETSQKPLVSINKKHMIDTSPRVQRLIVRSFPYLPFKVVYKKGTDISVVTPMDTEDNIQLPIIAVNMITTWILMSLESQGSFSNKLDQLRKSTEQDEQLTRLKGYISTGFSCNKKNLPADHHQFWPHKEMLSIKSGLITCGNRIIVPKEMRPEMLQYVHDGHQGKERCLLRAKNTAFWPKITYDVQQLIEKCIICQEHGMCANRHVLLEKYGLSNSSRCLFKILHIKEIAKFHICSHLCRTIYDCKRIRPGPHYQK